MRSKQLCLLPTTASSFLSTLHNQHRRYNHGASAQTTLTYLKEKFNSIVSLERRVALLSHGNIIQLHHKHTQQQTKYARNVCKINQKNKMSKNNNTQKLAPYRLLNSSLFLHKMNKMTQMIENTNKQSLAPNNLF